MFSETLGVVLSSFKMTTILKGMRRYSLFLVLFFYSSRDWKVQIRLFFFQSVKAYDCIIQWSKEKVEDSACQRKRERGEGTH